MFIHSDDVRCCFFPHLLYYFLLLASVRLRCGLLPLNRPVAIRISHKYLLLGFSNFFTKAINSSMFPSFSFALLFSSSLCCDVGFFALVHVQCVFLFFPSSFFDFPSSFVSFHAFSSLFWCHTKNTHFLICVCHTCFPTVHTGNHQRQKQQQRRRRRQQYQPKVE